ncbi:uncharacterized protein LOC143543001 [Bidens hawaiensis]|uniref:uncharacterized protein LOC143543001 n=1 Tax=Bidens hawaiensis TaxID=980011 RepID=UPI00404B1C80
MQPLEIPEWKWEHITMDFITKLPRTAKQHDTIWVIVDRLTKSAHFLPIREAISSETLASLFIKEIVTKHGVPLSIVSDRDTRFTSRFWKKFHEAMGTRLNISTAYHPQTDGQSERTIQTLEDMLRACVLDFGGSWDDHLHLAEFSYNNSYHSSIGMPPFEMLYGRRCRTPVCWGEIGQKEMGSIEVVQETSSKFDQIKARMKAAQDRQKSYADKRRRPIEFNVGDYVMLKVSPWKGIIRFRKRGKLSPRYIGPFKIVKRVGEVAYKLDLPDELEGIHSTFHVSHLRKCLADDTSHVPLMDIEVDEQLNYIEQPIKIVDRKEKQLRHKIIPLVKTFNLQENTMDSDLDEYELESEKVNVQRMTEIYDRELLIQMLTDKDFEEQESLMKLIEDNKKLRDESNYEDKKEVPQELIESCINEEIPKGVLVSLLKLIKQEEPETEVKEKVNTVIDKISKTLNEETIQDKMKDKLEEEMNTQNFLSKYDDKPKLLVKNGIPVDLNKKKRVAQSLVGKSKGISKKMADLSKNDNEGEIQSKGILQKDNILGLKTEQYKEKEDVCNYSRKTKADALEDG